MLEIKYNVEASLKYYWQWHLQHSVFLPSVALSHQLFVS